MTKQSRNTKRVLSGVVVSKQPKTIKVMIERYKNHPLYGKRFKISKNYQVHDELNVANIGDKVKIIETRRFSKTKSFGLLKITEHASKGEEV